MNYIAETIYFLAEGDRSSFMTGQSLVVDGGAIALVEYGVKRFKYES
jgi:NAD(P)-dependent dehydrogenase (short-subunit alcohol dehydrogenase family)